ncbi:uncharacterized protein LOC144199120 isoform X3 [Stigmatopora nigra]
MFNRRGQSQSSSSRCQTPKWRMPLHGRALLSCSELTICRRKSLNEHRLLGNIKNVAKTTRKEQLEDAITKIPPKGDKLMCPQRFFKIKESTKGDLVSAYEQIASGTPTYEVFQNKRGWRRFNFLRCWSTNGNQSMKFFKIKEGGEDSIFYDAVTPAGTYLQTFSK